jgi:tRNA (cytidine/uridine-2'-O-)-methyltransferase
MAACFGVATDIIGPAGFDMTDKALRRAGLDYLEHAILVRHESWEAFLAARALEESSGRLVLLTSAASQPLTEFRFAPDDTLLLGRESAGVPESVHNRADARIRIPMRPGLRSLNIAVAAAVALGEALRQTGGFPE